MDSEQIQGKSPTSSQCLTFPDVNNILYNAERAIREGCVSRRVATGASWTGCTWQADGAAQKRRMAEAGRIAANCCLVGSWLRRKMWRQSVCGLW